MMCVWLFLSVHVIRQRREKGRSLKKKKNHLPTSSGLIDVDSHLWGGSNFLTLQIVTLARDSSPGRLSDLPESDAEC